MVQIQRIQFRWNVISHRSIMSHCFVSNLTAGSLLLKKQPKHLLYSHQHSGERHSERGGQCERYARSQDIARVILKPLCVGRSRQHRD